MRLLGQDSRQPHPRVLGGGVEWGWKLYYRSAEFPENARIKQRLSSPTR
jgi:hypothetical protein